MPDIPTPDLSPEQRVHIRDQMTGFLREEAQQAGAYFGELVRQGLKRPEALQLTLGMTVERFRAIYAPKP